MLIITKEKIEYWKKQVKKWQKKLQTCTDSNLIPHHRKHLLHACDMLDSLTIEDLNRKGGGK